MAHAPLPRRAALDSLDSGQLDLPLFDSGNALPVLSVEVPAEPRPASAAPVGGACSPRPGAESMPPPSAPLQAPVEPIAAPLPSLQAPVEPLAALLPPLRPSSKPTSATPAPSLPTGATPRNETRLPDSSRLRCVSLGSHRLDYRLKRSARRTIGFSIDGNGLAVTAPRWATLADIEAALADKQRWIFAKLAEWQTRTEQRALPRIVWTDGATLPYLGKPLTIAITSSSGTLRHDPERAVLELGLPPDAHAQQIKDRVQGWLQQEARRLFGERLDIYAQRLGVRHSAYALSSAATRWGSCSSDGKIRLNWRLIHFPLSIIDYVVAHELAHLREMNHSSRFWDTVASIFPEFREARSSLKNHPMELLPTL
ncbi:YgjP-like metallopeptidase domain-containing protein [Mycetohabitans sp. B2]|uniref:M48 family metallopeptidase n=1 Tax=Mycetohabitans sp. B2 TaxID=2841274 RepID=UPI003FA60C56